MRPVAEGRRRRAWDEVQWHQRRDRERADAEHQAAVDAAPDRPLDVWRGSGDPVEVLRPELDPGPASEPST